MKTAQAAKGKWHGVLKELGVDESHLKNVHGPCPLCGGRDRFRFDDKDGAGTYYCNVCGPGDGMKLAMEFTGEPFKDLARRIDGMVGNIEAEKPKKATADPGKRISRLWSASHKIEVEYPVHKYLMSRNLPISQALRSNGGVNYYEDGKKVGTYPCMVAPVQSSEGQMVTVHITHLTSEGRKADVAAVKKMLPPMRPLPGSAIRLTKIYEHIGIAEGIETALAVMKTFRMPCWAAMNADMMERFVAPKGVRGITVFADNDENYRGQAAAYRLAHNAIVRQGLLAEVRIPCEIGDFADLLEKGRAICPST